MSNNDYSEIFEKNNNKYEITKRMGKLLNKYDIFKRTDSSGNKNGLIKTGLNFLGLTRQSRVTNAINKQHANNISERMKNIDEAELFRCGAITKEYMSMNKKASTYQNVKQKYFYDKANKNFDQSFAVQQRPSIQLQPQQRPSIQLQPQQRPSIQLQPQKRQLLQRQPQQLPSLAVQQNYKKKSQSRYLNAGTLSNYRPQGQSRVSNTFMDMQDRQYHL